MIETWRRLCEMCVFSLHEFTISSSKQQMFCSQICVYHIYIYTCTTYIGMIIPLIFLEWELFAPFCRRKTSPFPTGAARMSWTFAALSCGRTCPKRWRPRCRGSCGGKLLKSPWGCVFFWGAWKKMTKNHGTWKRTIEYCKEMICDNVTFFFCEKSWWSNHFSFRSIFLFGTWINFPVKATPSRVVFLGPHSDTRYMHPLQLGRHFQTSISINKWVVCWKSHLAEIMISPNLTMEFVWSQSLTPLEFLLNFSST